MALVLIVLEGATKEEVLAKRETEYQRYHPAGYGTHIREPVEQVPGRWVAVGDRFSSCD